MSDQRPWFVYILRCSNTFLYTGISPDVKKRVLNHRAGKGAKFTRNKHPIELVYLEKMENMKKAMIKEREIKRYQKSKKEKLIIEFSQNSELKEDIEIKEILTVNDTKMPDAQVS